MHSNSHLVTVKFKKYWDIFYPNRIVSILVCIDIFDPATWLDWLQQVIES